MLLWLHKPSAWSATKGSSAPTTLCPVYLHVLSRLVNHCPPPCYYTHTCTLTHPTPTEQGYLSTQESLHPCLLLSPCVHSSSVHKMVPCYPSFWCDPASYSIWPLPVIFVVCCSPMQCGYVTSMWHTLARTENIFRYKMRTGLCGAVVIILVQHMRHPWFETEWKQVFPFPSSTQEKSPTAFVQVARDKQWGSHMRSYWKLLDALPAVNKGWDPKRQTEKWSKCCLLPKSTLATGLHTLQRSPDTIHSNRL